MPMFRNYCAGASELYSYIESIDAFNEHTPDFDHESFLVSIHLEFHAVLPNTALEPTMTAPWFCFMVRFILHFVSFRSLAHGHRGSALDR
jgi:hypothetical protein